MKKKNEFLNIMIYILDTELEWYKGYVFKNVDEKYAEGFIAGIRMAKDLMIKVYRQMYVE